MMSWFNVTSRAGTGRVSIHGDIGEFGITFAAFKRELDAVGNVREVDVSVNSAGGSVFDGMAVYAALKAHPARVTVTIAGVAASIASTIAMAGDVIVMPVNSLMMLHDPSAAIGGRAEELRGLAELLDKIAGQMADVYAGRSGQPRAKILEMMARETWLDAREAKALGFVDRVTDEVRVAAHFDLARRYDHAPTELDAAAQREVAASWRRREAAARAEIERIKAEQRDRAAAARRRWTEFCDRHPLAPYAIAAAFARGGRSECERVSGELLAACERGEARPDMIGDEAAVAALRAVYAPPASPGRHSAARH